MNLKGETKRENAELIVLRAFLNDIKESRGTSMYKLLKEANLKPNYYSSIDRNIRGKKGFRKVIKLSFIVYLSELFNYPFDLSKYMHLYKDEEAAEADK